jgi:hypothetical protein
LLPGATLGAQRSPRLDIVLPAPIARAATDGPIVTAYDMLAGTGIREPLNAGFPARFHFRVELWNVGGLFNQLVKHAEYDVFVQFVALEKLYQVMLVETDRAPFSLGRFASIEDAELAIARPRRVPISAPTSNRPQYYQATLTAYNAQVSDIDELSGWLRGEVGPTISGKRNPGTFFTRTLRSFAARILGGSAREYQKTTEQFLVP